MQYLSPEFGIVFVVFLWLYWMLFARVGVRAQNISLLVASYLFYFTISWKFLLLLMGYSAVIVGLSKLSYVTPIYRERWPVILGVIASVINLGIFKYYNFFRESISPWLTQIFHGSSLPVLDILLPVGISFYTFQGIAYLVSVGRAERAPAGWLNGLLHLSFFPTLLAGPICRPAELLTQIENNESRSIKNPEFIMVLIVFALVKKVWLAAWLADNWVNPLFNNPDGFHPIELFCGLMAYAWQLFFDFSGYTDIVTAFALLLGFQLPKNFDQPYLAAGLSDFWRRWHMTLSRWIRDFVYIPLGGNRGTWARTQVNMIIAMVVSGFWHGASLSFILWGLWHGVGLALQNAWRQITDVKLPHSISVLITFVFVCFGWLLFRAADWDTASIYIQAFSDWQKPVHQNVIGLVALVGLFFFMAARAQIITEFLVQRLQQMNGFWQGISLMFVAYLIIQLSPDGMPGFIYFGF